MENKEYILCAANYYDDKKEHVHKPKNIKQGFIICGHRHHNCIFIFSEIVGFPYSEEGIKLQNTEIQGFLTNTNRFVDRIEGAKIALESGQIEKLNYPPRLFSEDLY